ncbi:MAG: hypothetical protein Q9221_006126 [Calogaya cf. arnoldii]
MALEDLKLVGKLLEGISAVIGPGLQNCRNTLSIDVSRLDHKHEAEMLKIQGLGGGVSQHSHNFSIALPPVTPSATVLVESPFFLRPTNDTSPGVRLSQIQEDEDPTESLTFPLTKLPTELQLRVLWHCVVSSLPLLNAGIPKANRISLVDGEISGQRRINVGILRTCKAFHYEGTKLLLSRNQFAYTCNGPPDIWRCEGGMGTKFLQIKRLVLRPICRTDSQFSHRAAVLCLYWLRHFRNLTTLRVDFCGVTRGFQYEWDEDNDSMSLLAESVDNMLVDRMNNGAGCKGLSELILTGLPENDLGLFVLRAMALLMHAGGKVGIGTGQEGKRYLINSDQYYWTDPENLMTLRNDKPRLEALEPQMHWLLAQHVPALVERAATDTSSKWLIGDTGLVSQRMK